MNSLVHDERNSRHATPREYRKREIFRIKNELKQLELLIQHGWNDDKNKTRAQDWIQRWVRVANNKYMHSAGIAWGMKVLAKYAKVSMWHTKHARDVFAKEHIMHLLHEKIQHDELHGKLNQHTLSSIIHAMGSLRVHVSDESYNYFIQRFVHDTKHNHIVEIQSLSDLLWGIVHIPTIEKPKDIDWNELLYQGLTKGDKASPQNLTCILWSMAKLGIHPTSQNMTIWTELFLNRIDQAQPLHLAMTLWSMATLGKPPTESFLEVVKSEFIKKHAEMDTQNLTNIIWAYATWKIKPDRNLIDAWLLAFESQVSNATALHLTNSAWGLASLDINPGKSFWMLWFQQWTCLTEDLQLRQLEGRVTNISPHNVSMSLWSLAKLDIEPPASFVDLIPKLVHSTIQQYEAHHLATTLWACARTDLKDVVEFMYADWYPRFVQISHSCSTKHLANMIWALAKLEIRPDEAFLQTWYSAFRKHMHKRIFLLEKQTHGQEFTNSDLSLAMSNSIWAFAKFGTVPEESFLDEWFTLGEHLVAEWNPQMLSNTLWSLAKLRVFPHDEFLDAWMKSFDASLQSCSAQHIANVIWSYGMLGIIPQEGHLCKCLDQFVKQLSITAFDEVFGVIWALSKLKQVGNISIPASCIAPIVSTYFQQASYSSNQYEKTVKESLQILGVDVEMKGV